MKKIIISCIIIIVLIIGIFIITINKNDTKKNNGLIHVTVAEPTLT